MHAFVEPLCPLATDHPDRDEQVAIAEDSLDSLVIAKFVSETGCRFYAVELESETGICYGYIDGDVNAWGYFSPHEFDELGFPVKQDHTFTPKPLFQALDDVRHLSCLEGPTNRPRDVCPSVA